MKLHLPISLRNAVLATLASSTLIAAQSYASSGMSVSTEAEQMAVEADWNPSNGSITLGAIGVTSEYIPEGSSTSESGHPIVDIDYISVLAGSNNIITVNEGDNIGYGVLGNGNTIITVDGTHDDGNTTLISDTSLKIQSFLNIKELNIDGKAVVTLSPGMFMNGDMDHDLAGKEGLEKSDGVVVIDSINLGQGSLILHNGDGFLFNNGYYDADMEDTPLVGDAVANAVGYTLNVTHDDAYVQIGTNMRSKWALINGLSDDGERHSLAIGGYARNTNITELKDIKDLTLSGGQFNIDKASGAIHGDLNIEHGATVKLTDGEANNNIMAASSGTLNVSGQFSIGNTTQTFTGANSINLHNAIIESKASSTTQEQLGSLVINTGDDDTVTLTYSGMQNLISTNLVVNEGATLDIQSNHLTGDLRDKLTLSGKLSGNGNMIISGTGMVQINNTNQNYTGNVDIKGGATLSLGHQHSLVNATKVTVHSHSHLNFDNPDYPVLLQQLHMCDGASLSIEGLETTLTYDATNAALDAQELTFDAGGSLNIVFNDEMAPMRVYNVLYSGNNIQDNAEGLTLNLYKKNAAGEHIKFDNHHYVTGYTEVDGKWLFYVETRFGNIWKGQNEGNWNDSSWKSHGDETLSHFDTSLYNYALFLNQKDVASSTINLTEKVNTQGIYINNVQNDEGQTNYTFVGQVDGVDIAGGTQIHMRNTAEGNGTIETGGTVTFDNVQAGSKDNTLDRVTVSVGTMALTNGSEFYYNADDMLQVGALGDAALTVDASSKLIAESGATLTAETSERVASISGVKMTGDVILGGNTEENRNISAITDAKLNGFKIEAIELRGIGSLTNGGIGADTGLSTDYNEMTSVAAGAHYTLGGNISFSQTLRNDGTVTIADGTSFQFANLKPNGNTYTFIDGNGTINGWNNMGLDQFHYHNIRLSLIKEGLVALDTSTPGQATITFNGISPIAWDTKWNIAAPPVFVKTFEGTTANAINFSNGNYAYSGIIPTTTGDTRAEYTTVVRINGGGSTSSDLYLGGGLSWGQSGLTQNYWILDTGSDYATKIGGMVNTSNLNALPSTFDIGTITGHTHLQIDGAGNRSDVEVYGGSWGMRQTGDAYLSINAGGYINIYGGSRSADLDGNVHMQLNTGTINTYFSGNTYSSPQGTNGEFIFNSASAAETAMGSIYQLATDSASHWGGIYATGSTWENGGTGQATKVLGNADIYIGSHFDFSTNLAVIDGGGKNVEGTSTLHFTDGVEYTNFNKDTIYAWIHAADERYAYLDQYSATDVRGEQPFIGKFTSIEIRGFDRIELADGAHVSVQASRFNMDQDITLSGGGIVELTRPEVYQLNYYGIPLSPFCEKDSEQVRSVPFSNRAIILENGVRLKISTDSITAWNANSGWAALTQNMSDEEKLNVSKNWSSYYDPHLTGDNTSSGYTGNNRSNITINTGTTLDITDRLRDGGGGSTLVDIFMAGHGTDGLGAIYKGVSNSDADTAFSFQFPYINLSDDASIGIAAGSSPIYMYGADNVYDNKYNAATGLYEESDYLGDYNQSTLKLNKHTLTVSGGGTLVLVNTTITNDVGGTLNVHEGTLRAVNTSDHRLLDWQSHGLTSENDARHVTIARTTDIVLSERGKLHTDLNNGSDDLNTPLGGGLQSLKFASLTGEGETNLEDFGLNGIELIVVRDHFYDEYMDQNKTYWNSNGYGYAFYSGAILGSGDSSVSKSGNGVQYFSGSSSTYGYTLEKGKLGGTYVSGGTLYLIGSSHFNMEAGADAFRAGSSMTKVGVIGGGELYWTSYMAGDTLNEGKVYLSDGVRILNNGCYYDNVKGDNLPQNMTIGVEAAPNGTALKATDENGNYIFLINQMDAQAVSADTQANDIQHNGLIILNGIEYVRIDTHNLSKINGISGIYLDGSRYNDGDMIDRNKMLLISKNDWDELSDNVTVTGLGTAGYNEATYSGILANDKDDSTSKVNLVKEGAGTLVLDQVTQYTGTTTVEGGTLRFKGWVNPNDIAQNTLTQHEGTSLMLSYDATYTTGGIANYDSATGKITMNDGDVNEVRELSQNIELVGRGDVRWNAETGWVASWVDSSREDFTDGETAALISDVGAGVDFTISGQLSGEGNLLHSGNGTLTLSNANTYTGGTVITRSHVYVDHDTALGATASGADSARVITWKNSHLHFNDGVHTTIAAPQTNSIEGSVYIGEKPATGSDSQATQLTMTGNGYWAEQTYVENWNSVLLFNGAGAANTNTTQITMLASAATDNDTQTAYPGNGAGILSGSGTVAVSDADQTGNLHDSFSAMQNFNGSVVVEGAGSSLSITEEQTSYTYNVESGKTATTGHITVTGQHAHFSAPKADIAVKSGSSMNLTSSGYTEYNEPGTNGYGTQKAATVTAHSTTIENGANLNVTFGVETGIYNNLSNLAETSKLTPDELLGYGLNRGTQATMDGAVGYDYHYDETIARNQTAAAAVTVSNLTMMGGSTYSATQANTNLCGGALTLDVSADLINLELKLDNTLQENVTRQQIVLFSGVNAINFIGVGDTDNYKLTLDGTNDVYYTMAENYFTSEYIDSETYLVWDASDGIVYLDAVVPEPTTTTMTLLALTALAARRRRK